MAFMVTDSTGSSQIWLRRMSALESLPLPGTEDARRPFWSPDSRFLGYLTGQGKAKKVSVLGGPPQPVGDAVGWDGSWGTGGFFIFDNTSQDSLLMINASGGVVAPASSFDLTLGETGHVWPHFLPDGEHFLFLALKQGTDQRVLKVGEIGSLESKVLGSIDSRFQYVSSGHILFVRDGTLLAQPFDPDALEYTGEPVPLAENVSTTAGSFGGSFSCSETGVLTYWEGQTGGNRILYWADREGNELEVLGEPAVYGSPTLSPDERHLLMEITDARTGTDDLWIRDLKRGTVSRFTFDPADDADAVWAPDGKTMVFSCCRSAR